MGNFVVGLFFHQCEHRRHLQLGRQASKCLLDLLPRLPLEEIIGLRSSGRFCGQTVFRTFAPEMVERQVGGDPPRPRGEVAARSKLVARSVDSPEGFYGQILSDARIAHDTHSPGADVALELPDQCLESIDLAMRKSPDPIHDLLYCLLRGGSELVTSFFNVRPNEA